ncbi:hypothetical protein [Paracoccus sulfuroxidans]|uniref:Uncharacterized protein n=1 Tax=Paracoccus sulfuroxidans TaxID=384678 RepID=A0A562NKS2_9RHOB|nr:hypothetical protein [Paracoccus sulfuroxidans]TWI32758.1 hypothetical protein IQ24_02633 [Paracoccus sulfuroxidans]
MLDLGQYEERAAIAEFDGGMTRFDAETMAAKEQGMARWQAVQIAKEAAHAQRVGIAGGHGHQADALARGSHALHLPGVQPASEEKARSMPERQQNTGRDRSTLPSLRGGHGSEVQR